MDWSLTYTSKSPGQTSDIGQSLAARVMQRKNRDLPFPHDIPRVFFLSGDLGSGKTTFIRGFVRGLGISARLLSPTFVIVRRYDAPGISGFFYHADLYRVYDKKAIQSTGLSEFLRDQLSIVMVEWSERLGSVSGISHYDLTFQMINETQRHILGKFHYEQ